MTETWTSRTRGPFFTPAFADGGLPEAAWSRFGHKKAPGGRFLLIWKGKIGSGGRI